MKCIFLILTLILSTASLSFADTVHLKSGRTVTGNILERSDKQIKIDANGITLTYYMDEVDRVESAENAATAETTTPGTSGDPLFVESKGSASSARDTSAYDSLSKEGLVLKYMEVTGVKNNMKKTFTDIIDAAPEEKKTELRQVLDLDDVLRQLIPVYEQYFSEQDLQELIAFYESDVGRKLLKTAPLILKDSMDRSLEYFQGKLE